MLTRLKYALFGAPTPKPPPQSPPTAASRPPDGFDAPDDGLLLLGRLLAATAWTPTNPATAFRAEVPSGPLGRLKTGRDTFAIIGLRRMAAERDMRLFTIDDRAVNLACCGSAFSGPVYDVKPGDSNEWFQGTLMLMSRWLQTVDDYSPWVERLGRIGRREGLLPYMRQFVEETFLPRAIASNPVA